MAASATRSDSLSSWWKVASIATMVVGFALLILITVKAYQEAPPIPAKTVDPASAVLFTSAAMCRLHPWGSNTEQKS